MDTENPLVLILCKQQSETPDPPVLLSNIGEASGSLLIARIMPQFWICIRSLIFLHSRSVCWAKEPEPRE